LGLWRLPTHCASPCGAIDLSLVQLVPLKTVLTYSNPNEADVDKSMLESEGIVVHLANRDSQLGAWNGPFMIQLQVNDEDVEKATGLIRSKSPARFGSEAAVKKAGDAFARGARRYIWSVVASMVFLFILEAIFNPNHVEIGKLVGMNLALGVILSVPVWLVYEGIRRIAKRD